VKEIAKFCLGRFRRFARFPGDTNTHIDPSRRFVHADMPSAVLEADLKDTKCHQPMTKFREEREEPSSGEIALIVFDTIYEEIEISEKQEDLVAKSG